MSNLKEINDDILKEWLDFREETAFCKRSTQWKKYCICFETSFIKILRTIFYIEFKNIIEIDL